LFAIITAQGLNTNMAKKTIGNFQRLDLESDVLAIREGDYRDALDITLLSDGNGNTLSVEPVLGNEFSDNMTTISVQPKVIRIQLATGASTYELNFRRKNYIDLGTATIAQNVSGAVTVANAIAAITGSITNAVINSFDNTNVTVDVKIEDSTINDYAEFVIYNTTATLAVFTTIQEAIDISAAGPSSPIGSFDLLGDLFKWGATTIEAPTQLDIVSVSNATGVIKLEVLNHGIQDGAAVFISGITDNSGNALDGEWMTESFFDGFGIFDCDHILLFGSTYDAPYVLNNPKITINPYSVGSISVCQRDVINDSTTNYILIQSKELNLRVQKQVDTYCENDQQKISLYFTDGFNPVRVLYYYGPYVANGFLNNYSYNTIGDESKLLIQDSNLTLEYDSTSTGVGQLKTGDYRYSVRLLTENESASNWTQLSNLINIYSGTDLIGNVDGTITNKANVLNVTGIPTGLFKYIELAYVIYQGEANVSFLASRTVITSSSMQLTHTGFEAEQQIDLGTLQSFGAGYETALSVDVLNNKMILSNLTTNQIKDFSAFAQTFTHELTQELITSVGESVSTAFDNYRFGEYFDTQNTYHKKTFVHNETYRFGLQVKLKGGALMPNIFWIDDIRFDTLATNLLADPTSDRRISGLPDYNLIDVGGTEDVYVASVIFRNIDWNYVIDGVRVIDLVERIYINQVEMISQYKEVLGSGLMVSFGRASVNAATTGANFGAAPANCQLPSGWANPDLVGEFNWFSGNTELVNGFIGGVFPNTYLTNGLVDKTVGIKYASFYSPDEYFANESISFQSGDQLLQFTELDRSLISSNQTTQGFFENAFKGVYQEHLGGTGATYGTFNLDAVEQVAEGGTKAFGAAGISVVKNSYISWEDSTPVTYNQIWKAPASPVCYCSTGFASTVRGHAYAQYYRPKGYYIKFGPKTESKYVPTGAYMDAPVIGSVESVQVYGDSFTQSSFYKMRAPSNGETPQGSAGTVNTFWKNGWGFEAMFYSQNRVNSQMRYPTSGLNTDVCPYVSIDQWNNSASFDIYTTEYTPSFTPRNQINVLPAYDPNAIDNTRFPTRIAYSQTKPNGSVTDEYRIFKPLDFRDLDMVNGEIIHHEVVNSELLTWQQRSFQRQYFNSNGLIQNQNGTEVILGDGAALSRRGVQLSSLGTVHKWSIVKGVSKGGNDVMAWWNTEYGYVVRFGYDGVNPISYVHNINGFVDKNTKWADIRFTPADREGIRGVWNDERKEYIWTITAYRTNKKRFNPRRYYNSGDSIWNYVSTQSPDVFNALRSTKQIIGSTVTNSPITDSSYWELQTSPQTRNEYTLAFSEFKDGFSCFYSFLPLFYAKWLKGYQGSSPYTNYEIFNFNRGQYGSWYNGALVANPYLQAVINIEPFLKKSFEAVELNSMLKPNSVGNAMEFLTEQHYSYLVVDDFDSDELHDIMYSSWIKNDATINAENPLGLNDIDNSNLFGEYLLAKFIFKQGEYNKLFGMTIKFTPRTRLNTT